MLTVLWAAARGFLMQENKLLHASSSNDTWGLFYHDDFDDRVIIIDILSYWSELAHIRYHRYTVQNLCYTILYIC